MLLRRDDLPDADVEEVEGVVGAGRGGVGCRGGGGGLGLFLLFLAAAAGTAAVAAPAAPVAAAAPAAAAGAAVAAAAAAAAPPFFFASSPLPFAGATVPAPAAPGVAGALRLGLSSLPLGSSGFPSTTLPPIRAATWSYHRATHGKCASCASGNAEHASATCAATTTSASEGLVPKLVEIDDVLATRNVRSSSASLSTFSASSLMSASVEWTLESQSAICARASLSVPSPSRAAFVPGTAAAWAIAKAAVLGWSMTVVPSASVSENASPPSALPCGSKERSTPAKEAVRRQALAARASLAESFIFGLIEGRKRVGGEECGLTEKKLGAACSHFSLSFYFFSPSLRAVAFRVGSRHNAARRGTWCLSLSPHAFSDL